VFPAVDGRCSSLLEADVLYLVRCIIHVPPWKDMFITVPEKVNRRAYRDAVFVTRNGAALKI